MASFKCLLVNFPTFLDSRVQKQLGQDELKRNIHIKRFVDVPLADLEMIFPDKRVYLKPLLLIQLFITILIGTISLIITFLTVILSLYLCSMLQHWAKLKPAWTLICMHL